MRSKKIVLSAIFIVTLSFHSILYYAVFIKNKPVFNKYPAFAFQYIHSAINDERLADFSPLYLSVHIIAQKYLGHPNEAILWLQFILVAGSAVLIFLLFRSFFSSWIALAGAMAFAINRSIAVYSSVFEPRYCSSSFYSAFLCLWCRISDPGRQFPGFFLVQPFFSA